MKFLSRLLYIFSIYLKVERSILAYNKTRELSNVRCTSLSEDDIRSRLKKNIEVSDIIK